MKNEMITAVQIAEQREPVMATAEMIYTAGLVPRSLEGDTREKTLARVMLAIFYGQQVGLNPFQAMAGVYVVNNVPNLYGPVGLSVIKRHPDCEYIKAPTYEYEGGNLVSCSVAFMDKSIGEEQSVTCLYKEFYDPSKGPWKKHPEDMLYYKCIRRIGTRSFPDALMGMSIADDEYEPREVAGKYQDVTEPSIADATAIETASFEAIVDKPKPDPVKKAKPAEKPVKKKEEPVVKDAPEDVPDGDLHEWLKPTESAKAKLAEKEGDDKKLALVSNLVSERKQIATIISEEEPSKRAQALIDIAEAFGQKNLDTVPAIKALLDEG